MKLWPPLMEPTTLETIAAMVRSGFYTRNRLLVVFCEEMYQPGDLVPAEVSAVLDSEFSKWAEEQKSWPDESDCDRLNQAFVAINRRNIIALQNAGYTQSDGYDDIRQEYHESPNKKDIVGYCFYHGQDLERAVRGEGLFLGFGPTDPEEEENKGPEVGRIVQEELERVGFRVEWNGQFSTRIHVPRITWQRRYRGFEDVNQVWVARLPLTSEGLLGSRKHDPHKEDFGELFRKQNRE